MYVLCQAVEMGFRIHNMSPICELPNSERKARQGLINLWVMGRFPPIRGFYG